MRYTEELKLPIYDNPESDYFRISDWNEGNQNLENKIKEHSETILKLNEILNKFKDGNEVAY